MGAGRGSRRAPARVVALAAIATLLLCAAGCSASSSPPKPSGPFSLDPAIDQLRQAQHLSYSLVNRQVPVGNEPTTVELDVPTKAATTDEDVGRPGRADHVVLTYDTAKQVIYVKTPVGAPASTSAWSLVDLREAARAGKPVTTPLARFGDSPFDLTSVYGLSGSRKAIGDDSLDGEPIRSYAVVVDVAAVVRSSAALKARLAGTGADRLEFTVAVTATNEVRQITLSINGGDGTLIRIAGLHSGPVSTLTPDPADVTDRTQQYIGSGGLYGLSAE